MKPTVVDLFAGVGGMSLGFERAGFDIVLANEYDKLIAAAYKANHQSTIVIVEDIKNLLIEKIFQPYLGKISVVVGGPPCQGFSQKGQRKSLNDERNFLFKYYIDVVKFLRPLYFVMENVPNILTAERNYFKNEILTLFKELGYNLEFGVLNSANFGVPQSRQRAVIIGKLGSPAPKLPTAFNYSVTIWDAISDLAFLESGEGNIKQDYKFSAQSKYQIEMRKGSIELNNHVATKHSKLVIERLKLIPPESGKEMLPKEHITKSIYSGTWTRMKKDNISATITTRFDTPSSGAFTHPFLNRAITVREAARLQSFPDTYKFIGTKSSQMQQVGNAVPPKLAQAIAQVIIADIEGGRNNEQTK